MWKLIYTRSMRPECQSVRYQTPRRLLSIAPGVVEGLWERPERMRVVSSTRVARMLMPPHAERAQIMCNLANSVESPAYVFTAAELMRMSIYRAAVQAGFYSDSGRSRPSNAARADRRSVRTSDAIS